MVSVLILLGMDSLAMAAKQINLMDSKTAQAISIVD